MVQRRKSKNTKCEVEKIPTRKKSIDDVKISHAKLPRDRKKFSFQAQHCVIKPINCIRKVNVSFCWLSRRVHLLHGSMISQLFMARTHSPKEKRNESSRIWISGKLWMKRFMLCRKSISLKRQGPAPKLAIFRQSFHKFDAPIAELETVSRAESELHGNQLIM